VINIQHYSTIIILITVVRNIGIMRVRPLQNDQKILLRNDDR